MEETKTMVTLQRQHNLLFMQPPCPGVLDCLRSVTHELVRDRQQGSYLKATCQRLYDLPTTGGNDSNHRHGQAGITLAGLEPVVKHLLQEKGCRIQCSASRSLSCPDLDAVQSHGVMDQGLLQLVQQHDRGLVRYGQQVDPAWLIAQIGLAYPDLSIAVAVATVSDAKAFASLLRRWFPSDVTFVQADKFRSNLPRIVVGTYTALMGGCMDIQRRNLLIAPAGIEILGKRGVELLQATEIARLLALLPQGRQLAPRDADHLQGCFGFQEVIVPAHGHHPLPVEVVFKKVTGGDNLPGNLAGVALLRRALWHNGLYNRRIAKLACAFRKNDQAELKSFKRSVRAIRAGISNRVAVLVENIEQGIALSKQLPGWRLATGEDVNLERICRADRKVYSQAIHVRGTNPNTIFTTAAAEQIDPREIDVLIRADAGTGLPAMKEELLLPCDNHHKLLLVDFDDRRHHELGRLSRKRRRAYREQGWYSPGADPVQERVQDFLAARPKG